jgi:hypothetical protein
MLLGKVRVIGAHEAEIIEPLHEVGVRSTGMFAVPYSV